ncbi:MAG: hypothetical protein AB2401_00755 [Bacillus sp. (in: firmicutes)]
MKKTGVLILAAAIGLGFSSNVHIPVAIAAESTPTILPINLAVNGTVSARVELDLAMEQRTSFAGLKIRNIAGSFVL